MSVTGPSWPSCFILFLQQEAVGNLRKAQSLYVTRQQEYEKAKEVAQKAESDALSTSSSNTNLVAKIDKRKKIEEEALHRVCFIFYFSHVKRKSASSMSKIHRFRSSCTYAKYHPGLCSSFIYPIVSNGSYEQWHLNFHCLQKKML